MIALCPGMTLTDAIPEDVKLALLSPNFIHLWDKDVAPQAPQAYVDHRRNIKTV